MPLVTCHVATHDRPMLVSRAVRCALHQADGSIEVEVLVHDDGPVPVSLDDVVWSDPRVRYLRVGPMSLATKRNRAVEEARGEFMAAFDDDDWSRSTRLAVQLDAIRGRDACIFGQRLVCHDLDTGAVYVHCVAPGQLRDTGALIRRSAWVPVPDVWQHYLPQLHEMGPRRRAVVEDVTLLVSGIDDWNRARRSLSGRRWLRWNVEPRLLYNGTAPWDEAPRRIPFRGRR